MSGVIVGVDAAGRATRRAVRWAAEQASARGVGLRLVALVEPYLSAELTAKATEFAQDCLADLTAELSGISPTVEIVGGVATDVFEKLSSEADLTVIGSDWHNEARPTKRAVSAIKVVGVSNSPIAVVPNIDVSGRRGVAVGVDGSEQATRAIGLAVVEAQRLAEPLVVVHAWDQLHFLGGEYGYGTAMVVADDLARAAAELLDAAVTNIAASYPQLEVSGKLIAGDPVTALSDVAGHSRLLVVGSHGRGALARFLLGSVSHGVLAQLNSPVVIVR